MCSTALSICDPTLALSLPLTTDEQVHPALSPISVIAVHRAGNLPSASKCLNSSLMRLMRFQHMYARERQQLAWSRLAARSCTHHLAVAACLAGPLDLQEVVVPDAGLPVRRGPVGGHDGVEGPVLRGVLQQCKFQGFANVC
jgi:hypothetical protein